jgi:hypothetical protein
MALALSQPEFWNLKVTAGIEITRNPLIWHVQQTKSANLVWKFLPYGFPLSVRKLIR